MSQAPRFYPLTVTRISPEAAGAVAITLAVPPYLSAVFAFEAGQFVTVRTQLQGQECRRSYSICSTPEVLQAQGTITVGVRPVAGGVFSNWAAQVLQAGQSLDVMPPEGRFTVQRPGALHRVGFAAGSGITPILPILTRTLESSPVTKFTLVYGNKRMDSVMFNEALQDLKDRFPGRLTLIHVLSRQAQEVSLLEGRIDADKVCALMAALLPAASMDEVFICGPEGMIEQTQAALLSAGVPHKRIHSERFASPNAPQPPAVAQPQTNSAQTHGMHTNAAQASSAQGTALTVVLDGKSYPLRMEPHQRVLEVALQAGLDLPWSCKGGVCCTCRAKVVQGSAEMDKNFTLEPWEMAQGFVLTCQARATSAQLSVSFDER